jgi:tetratricopeptide (TPR) repeat protein
MSNGLDFYLQPPAIWQQFETLCLELFGELFGNVETQKYGRPGQTQQGVDIIHFIVAKNEWIGIQCKQKEVYPQKFLLESEVLDAVEDAKKFQPKLSKLVIATTARRDVKIQTLAAKITDENTKNGLFSVQVCSWDDLQDLLFKYPDLIKRFYPSITVNSKPEENNDQLISFVANPQFTGRMEIFNNIDGFFSKDSHSPINIALNGLGGVGKTEIAKEYAQIHKNEYNRILFVSATSSEVTSSTISGSASSFHIDASAISDKKVLVKQVIRQIEQTGPNLIIFDNAETPGDLEEFLPKSGKNYVIVTSRNPLWNSIAHPISVDVFKREESIEFFVKKTGQEQDLNAINELSNELGDLPLALEQAASYIIETGRTVPDYLSLYRQYPIKLLTHKTKSSNYPVALAKTWDLSFKKIVDEYPIASDFLNLCAFLAPDKIPLDLLSDHNTLFPKNLADAISDSLKFDEIIASLLRYSLIKRNGNYLTIHRLVQAVIRSNLNKSDKKEWTKLVLHLTSDAFPENIHDYQIWKKCSDLLPHSLVALDQSEEFDFKTDVKKSQLLIKVGLYLETQAEYEKAKKMFSKALEIDKRIFGRENPAIIKDLNYIGDLYRHLEDYYSAKKRYEQALVIAEKKLPENHPEIALCYNNLGLNYWDFCKYDTAIEYLKKSLAIHKEILGCENPFVASCLTNLGLVYLDLNNYDQAEKNLLKALEIDEKIYKFNHLEISLDHRNLGDLYLNLNNIDLAKEHYDTASQINQSIFGLSHPEISKDLTKQGFLCLEINDFTGAKEKFQAAYEIDSHFFDKTRPTIGLDLDNIGYVLLRLDDYLGAKEKFLQFFEIAKLNYGYYHINTAKSLMHLADADAALDDIDGCEKKYLQVLDIFLQLFGDKDERVQHYKQVIEKIREFKLRNIPNST